MIEPRCPCCDTAAALPLGRRGLHRCARCGHAFLQVGTTVTPAERAATYDAHYDGFRPDPRFAAAVREFLATELTPRLPRGARVLDVGCGNGEFLAAATEAGLDARGVDAHEAAVAKCRARGLRADCADLLGPLPDPGPYHLVTLWDVLEHLEHPVPILARCRELLTPGGLVFLKTPGTGRFSVDLSAALPRLSGALLHTPDHVQFFGRRSLEACLGRAGLAVTEWLAPRAMRSPGADGGLPKRLKRATVRAIRRVSGDRNWIVLCQRTSLYSRDSKQR